VDQATEDFKLYGRQRVGTMAPLSSTVEHEEPEP
jgi:hypothetical protein